VHQDLGLIPTLTVVENLRVERIAQPANRWFISWRREGRRARTVFSDYGLDIDPGAKVSELQPVERAFLAIVRALEGLRETGGTEGLSHAVLVLDEPTVFLSASDRDRLFSFVRQIASAGGSILLVSHDLDEVRAHTDRITVLRDGHAMGTVVTGKTTERELIGMIIGRALEKADRISHRSRSDNAGAVIQSLQGGRVSHVSFSIAEGEVLGITGQIGAGFEDVPYLLFGASPCQRGTLDVRGITYSAPEMTPAKAIRLGIALLPADRQGSGSIGSLPAIDTVMLQVLDRYVKRGVLARWRMQSDARRLFDRFDVRPNDPKLTYSALSGGNQQKALLAKWLQTSPSLLLLHEPTIGVDIGARQTIFTLVREAAANGSCVLCASVDHEQLADICDRVLIFSRGAISEELTGSQLTKDNITEHCYDLARSVASENAFGLEAEGEPRGRYI